MALDFPAAPTVGSKFVVPSGTTWQWDGTKWIAVASSVAGASGNVGRNLVHNPLFNIAQRGVGPFTGLSSNTLDRWLSIGVTDTVSYTQAALTDADRAAIGDEAAINCLQNVFTGNAAVGAYNRIEHRIENVRRLAGKTVMVSFWAKAAAGTPKLGININQWVGTGGSPSGGGWALAAGNSVTLSTGWTRYTSTIAIPSSAGWVLGSNGDSSTWLVFAYSSGVTNAAILGNPGVQSGTIQLWGVQLEIVQPGQVQPTSLERPDPQQDLVKCQRFFEVCNGYWIGDATNGAPYYVLVQFIVEKRATPTIASIVQAGTANGGFNARAGSALNTHAATWGGTVSAVTGAARGFADVFSASADL